MFIKNKIRIPLRNSQPTDNKIIAINAMIVELARMGYLIPYSGIDNMMGLPEDEAIELSSEIVKRYCINGLTYPLIPNWEDREVPWDLNTIVIQLSEYWKGIIPNFHSRGFYKEFPKPFFADKNMNPIPIELASADEYFEHFEDICKNGTTDNFTLINMMKQTSVDQNWKLHPKADMALRLNGRSAPIKITDSPENLLRYFASKVDLDTWDLPSSAKFASMTWNERNLVMKSFNHFIEKTSVEDFLEKTSVNRGLWAKFIRHGNFLRQKSFWKKYPILCTALLLTTNSKVEKFPKKSRKMDFMNSSMIDITEGGTVVYRTFASRMNTFIDERDYHSIVLMTKKKPVYVYKNLATVLNGIDEEHHEAFLDVLKVPLFEGRIPVHVLASIWQIDVEATYRIIDAKGVTVVKEADYPEIIGRLQKVIEREFFRLNDKEIFGKLDGLADDDIVPMMVKNKGLPRGHRISYENESYLYMFMHWVENEEMETDLDHSLMAFDTNWNTTVVNFGNQVNDYITQSGDFVSAPAPEGASEYSRIDLNNIPDDIRYIALGINVYSGQNFSKLPTAFSGIMFGGESFSIQREHHKFELTEPSEFNVPFIMDTRTKEIIFLDFNETHESSRYVDVSTYTDTIRKLVVASNNLKRLTVGKAKEILNIH